MIRTGLFDRSHLSVLKRAVDVYARRHQVTVGVQLIENVPAAVVRIQQPDTVAGAWRSS